MNPLDHLCLPADIASRLQAGGIFSIEELCQRTLMEVGRLLIPGTPMRDTQVIRKALAPRGLDLRCWYDDPVGTAVTPSRTALHSLFEYLDLAPDTRTALKVLLLGGSTTAEFMSAVDPVDRWKSVRLLELFEECSDGSDRTEGESLS